MRTAQGAAWRSRALSSVCCAQGESKEAGPPSPALPPLPFRSEPGPSCPLSAPLPLGTSSLRHSQAPLQE